MNVEAIKKTDASSYCSWPKVPDSSSSNFSSIAITDCYWKEASGKMCLELIPLIQPTIWQGNLAAFLKLHLYYRFS
jgi:hypothetical protein